MPITRINEFKAAEGKELELFEFLTSLTAYITTSEGNLGCEVLQSQSDNGHIVVIEKWQNETAHRESITNYPQEKMQAAMSLIGAPPKGEYYSA